MKALKPTLRRKNGVWVCSAIEFTGFGVTPAEAYADMLDAVRDSQVLDELSAKQQFFLLVTRYRRQGRILSIITKVSTDE